jgi:hypothetical protein
LLYNKLPKKGGKRKMRRKKILAVAFFAILVSAMLILPKSLTITSGAMKTSDILGDPKVSNEILSQRVQQEFSETALEYLVNKPTDPAINKTIIDPNLKEALITLRKNRTQ